MHFLAGLMVGLVGGLALVAYLTYQFPGMFARIVKAIEGKS